MIYKATLALSLFFLAVVGSAQDLNNGGPDTSAQPPISSMTASQVYPSNIPTPTIPSTSDGDPSQTNRTGPSSCHPHNGTHSAIPTDKPLPSGVIPSAENGTTTSSPVSKPHFSCIPDSGSTIPTGTASVSAYGDGTLPSTNVSMPIHNGPAPTGTDHHDGNFSLPTGSPEPSSSGPDQQEPPLATATTTYVGRRRLVRRQF